MVRANLREFGMLNLSYLVPLRKYPYTGTFLTECPVCGSKEHSTIVRMDRRFKKLDTSICHNCGLFFTNPMPGEEELSAYYRDMYRIDQQFAVFSPPGKHLRKKQREAVRRYDIVSQNFDVSKPIEVLDFGCGTGEIALEFAKHGHKASGFEPGKTYSNFAAGHFGNAIDFRDGKWQEMTYADKSFDVIICLHVLEHLREPVEALKRMHQWLRDDGILYLEVPNLGDAALKGFEQFHFDHLCGYSRDNLVLAGERAGFIPLREMAPTSIIYRKSKANEKPAMDLQKTAEKNRAGYGKPVTAAAYLGHRFKRLGNDIRKKFAAR
jgi:SAM-dependent methyltransferase